MNKTLKNVTIKFLNVIERDAKNSYKKWDGKEFQWNEAIWKAADYEYYKYWKTIKTLIEEAEDKKAA